MSLFAGSAGSVSSLRSLYSSVRIVFHEVFIINFFFQSLSDSFDTISADQFRSSLEDEMS